MILIRAQWAVYVYPLLFFCTSQKVFLEVAMLLLLLDFLFLQPLLQVHAIHLLLLQDCLHL